MNELQLVHFENTELSTWDFSLIKNELQQHLTSYEGVVYTEEKDAKKDKTTLNKVKKTITDAEKAYKNKCLEPYEAIKPRIDELVNLVEEHIMQIDTTVKEFETRKKEEKEQLVRKYYDRKAVVLGTYADALYVKLFDKKWTNATTAKSKYEEEIQEAINQAAMNMETIQSWDSPFTKTLIETYVATLSVEQAKEKNTELKEAAKNAGISSSPAEAVAKTVSSNAENDENGTVLRIYAGQNQINQITDFMKAIGVRYEVL